MGQSADAKLAFGFDLGDGYVSEIVEEASLEGLVKPTHRNYQEQDWKDYRKAVEAFPFKVLHHGYDFSGTFLALKETVQTAYWENPKEVSPLYTKPDQIEALKAFCEKHGIEWKEPTWHLMAHYA